MQNELKTIRIRIPKEIWKRVSKVAIDLEVTKGQVVNKALKAYLVSYERKVKSAIRKKTVKTARKVKK